MQSFDQNSVATAVSVLHSGSVGMKDADKYLDAFQKIPAAWQIAMSLLATSTTNLPTRLFAAQTIRQKVLYDIKTLDLSYILELRDSLIQLLVASTEKLVATQIILSLADLSVVMIQWDNPIEHMASVLANNSPRLLEFYTIIAQEYSHPSKFNLNKGEFNLRADKVFKANSAKVLDHLVVLFDNPEFHLCILQCAYGWVYTGLNKCLYHYSGDISVEQLSLTPILSFAFHALTLESDDVFDAAVDLVVEAIAKTHILKLTRTDIVHDILNRISPLMALIKADCENEDRMRGYCRIIVEAAEVYQDQIMDNFISFKGIVDAIIACTSCKNFEVVQITFHFWYTVSEYLSLPDRVGQKGQWKDTFCCLIDIIIQHFHYPDDLSTWSAQEREDFREFRHVMGDVLKDAVTVVGPQMALLRPLAMLHQMNAAGSFSMVKWQDVEAPLFSIRSMGGQISDDESVAVPQLMAFLPQLPSQPKVQYAAILVIGRYANWTAKHPEYIDFQVQIVTRGFADQESISASALALKYLCEFCGPLMVKYLGQLHQFYNQVIASLSKQDQGEITEAVAHVIQSVDPAKLQVTLEEFCLPTAQRLHDLGSAGLPTSSEESVKSIEEILGLLNRLAIFLRYVSPVIPDGQLHPVVPFLTKIWPLISTTLTVFGGEPKICEGISRVLRYAIDNTQLHLMPLLPTIIEVTIDGFEKHESSSFLWMAKKLIEVYAREEDSSGMEMSRVVERMSAITVCLFRKCDRLDDKADGLQIDIPEALGSVLYFIRKYLELISPNRGSNYATQENAYASRIRVIPEYGYSILNTLIDGMLFTFPREREIVRDVGGILYIAIDCVDDGILMFCKCIMELDASFCSAEEKRAFCESVSNALLVPDSKGASGACMRRILDEFAVSFRRRNLIQSRH